MDYDHVVFKVFYFIKKNSCRQAYTDASTDVSRFVTLFRMAFQAGFFNIKRGHIPVFIIFGIPYQCKNFFFSIFKLMKGFCFPDISPVSRPDGFKACNMVLNVVNFFIKIRKLPCHKGRINHGELCSVTCCDITVGNIKVGVWHGCGCNFDIHSAMSGIPQSCYLYLLEK